MYVRLKIDGLNPQQLLFLQDARILKLVDTLDGVHISELKDKVRLALESAKVLPTGKQNYGGLMEEAAQANQRYGAQAMATVILQGVGNDHAAAGAFMEIIDYRRMVSTHLEMIRGEYVGYTVEATRGPIEAHAVNETSDGIVGERLQRRQAALGAMTKNNNFTPRVAEEKMREVERAIRTMAENDHGLKSLVPARH